MTAEDTTTVSVTRPFAAPAEKIFDAFLDVNVAKLFLFATKTGEMITAQIDPRVGGKFTFVDRRPDMGGVRHVGEYLEITRPRRLVFKFGVPQLDPRMTTVSIDIEPKGNGCDLTLTHSGVPPKQADGTRDGWSRILAGLLPAYDGIKAAAGTPDHKKF